MAARLLLLPTLGSLTLLAVGLAAALGVALVLPAGRALLQDRLGPESGRATALAWTAALVATLGSLFFSEVMELEPCKLCWLQRIAMYPLVVVLGVALLRRDAGVWMTALPLSLGGGIVSAYHVLLQHNPGLELTECSLTAPCSLRYFAVFGFISIPVMAGAAFLLIGAAMTVSAVTATLSLPDAPPSPRSRRRDPEL